MGTKMTKFEEAVYAFALRYASGRQTYAHRLVIDEIIRHLKDFPNPESFLREVEIRRGDASRGFVPWDIDEEAEFINLEIQIKAEIERRGVRGENMEEVDVFAKEDLIAAARLLKANCKLRNDYCGNCPFKNDEGDSYLCELKGKGGGRLPFEWKIYPSSVCPNAILDSEKEKPSQATVYEWTFKTEKE